MYALVYVRLVQAHPRKGEAGEEIGGGGSGSLEEQDDKTRAFQPVN